MPRTIAIDDRLASWQPIRLPTRDLIACGAWPAGAAAVTVVAVPRVAMACSYDPRKPTGPTTELAFHGLYHFRGWAQFMGICIALGTRGPSAGAEDSSHRFSEPNLSPVLPKSVLVRVARDSGAIRTEHI
jgi:hypothetical protein